MATPTTQFDPVNYLSQNIDVLNAIANGLFGGGVTTDYDGDGDVDRFDLARFHFETFGWNERRNPNSTFDTSAYLAANPDVAAAGVNPFQHFQQFGVAEGRSPNASIPSRANFDATTYLANNPDLGAAGLDTPAEAYQHFINHGQFEGRPAKNTTGETITPLENDDVTPVVPGPGDDDDDTGGGGGSTGGNTITLSAPSAVVDGTTKTNADAVTTVNADTIKSSYANLSGSKVDGLDGTDTLVMSDVMNDTIKFSGLGASDYALTDFTNIETLKLASGGTNKVAQFDQTTTFKTIVGSDGKDQIYGTTAMRDGASISLGAGNDTLYIYDYLDDSKGDPTTTANMNVDLGSGDDSFGTTTANGDSKIVNFTANTVIDGGTGTDTFYAVKGTGTVTGNVEVGGDVAEIWQGTVKNFENLVLHSADTYLQLNIAQYNQFTTIESQEGAGTNGGVLAFHDSGTVTAKTVTEIGTSTARPAIYKFQTGNNTFNAATGDMKVVGAAGVETFNFANGLTADDDIDGAGGTDILNITGVATGSGDVVNVETINVTFVTDSTFTTGAMAPGAAATIDASESSGKVTLDASAFVVTTKLTITDGQGNDTITIGSSAANRELTTVALATGGADTIAVAPGAAIALAGNAATINNFTAGAVAGADKIAFSFNGSDGLDGIDKGIDSNGAVTGAEYVVTITEASHSAADLTDDADSGAVETAIIAAIDLTTLSDGNDILVALGNGSGTATGIYAVDVTTAGSETIEVEHIMTLQGVDVDDLEAGNFPVP
ncbi:hypothetical protein F1188_01190 [Roseospira marina]|uniref:Calcium-binding protein n=1 Tax=Roseospira marina TaxID=140057 RepID=A0A5M6IGH2_9PROT|nr:hypothetical protein [Roseospira marina]KAA5607410.1 hypothetical protein F1188_01190 [Roseospira marina]MBB4312417.1 hypothetical protein [Roseospira marina]MBB5085567.1 hypothetical protein [Roseospira marina]